MNVGIIGTGKLGRPVAEVWAERGYQVYAYDLAPMEDIKETKEGGSIKYQSSIKEVVERSAITFIAVPTPHDKKYGGDVPSTQLKPKDFDYTILKKVLKEVNKYASDKQHVVLISTVLPGTIREQLIPLVPKCTFMYNPYLIAMGTVKEDFKSPEMVLVGTENGLDKESKLVRNLLTFYIRCTDLGGIENTDNNSALLDERFIIGTYEEIECIKVFYNTYISSKISFVNMIQDVAEKQGNIDVNVVIKALISAGTRIVSPAYMTPGMGDGGACHPRDNLALRYLSSKLKLGYDFFKGIMASREGQAKNMADYLCHLSDELRMPIVIHGKAYKPRVPYVDGSYSLLIEHYIKKNKKSVEYVDPYTGDTRSNGSPAVFLLAHSASTTYRYWDEQSKTDEVYCDFPFGSVIVDPWRKFVPPDDEPLEVIYYGNTRGKAEFDARN